MKTQSSLTIAKNSVANLARLGVSVLAALVLPPFLRVLDTLEPVVCDVRVILDEKAHAPRLSSAERLRSFDASALDWSW